MGGLFKRAESRKHRVNKTAVYSHMQFHNFVPVDYFNGVLEEYQKEGILM